VTYVNSASSVNSVARYNALSSLCFEVESIDSLIPAFDLQRATFDLLNFVVLCGRCHRRDKRVCMETTENSFPREIHLHVCLLVTHAVAYAWGNGAVVPPLGLTVSFRITLYIQLYSLNDSKEMFKN